MSHPSNETEMHGEPLKSPRGFVYVKLDTQNVKHMFGGEKPSHGDFTICGQKIVGRYMWAQRATALGMLSYCRECERVWSGT